MKLREDMPIDFRTAEQWAEHYQQELVRLFHCRHDAFLLFTDFCKLEYLRQVARDEVCTS